MEPIEANFQIVKLSENQYDILLFSEDSVLKSFIECYPESILIKQSKFGKPMVVIANFENKNMVNVFIGYWIKAFQEPSKSCNTCPLVKEFFSSVEKYRNPHNK